MKFILDYDFAAIIVMLTIIISFFRKKTINTIITKVFSILTLFNFLSLFFEIIASIAIGHSSSVNKFVLYLVKCCYFICSAGVATAFFNSICFSVESFKAKRDKYKIYTYIPYAIQLLLIITTPITRFYLDLGSRGLCTNYSLGILCRTRCKQLYLWSYLFTYSRLIFSLYGTQSFCLHQRKRFPYKSTNYRYLLLFLYFNLCSSTSGYYSINHAH